MVAGLDPELPVTEETMEQRIDDTLAAPMHWTAVLTVFAGVANVLALVGVFGLMTYAVRQRRREIGVRVALGANPRSVMWMIVADGMRVALPGTLLGVALALLAARWLNTFLFGVSATDAFTLLSVSLIVVSAALLACSMAGLRATRIHPLEAITID